MTEHEKAKIVESIENGAGKVMACRAANVDYRRFARTIKEDPGFALLVNAGRMLKREIALAVIYSGGTQEGGDPGPCKSYIELDLKMEAATRASVESREARKLKGSDRALMDVAMKVARLFSPHVDPTKWDLLMGRLDSIVAEVSGANKPGNAPSPLAGD